ncbi:GNAT family N-acetyltransferase [Nonomuraea roseoviolacea subsp. roseoviolacea]|uniref:Ribosomal protein S18 acetylase RimI-like enzyme n=1 Tax=Nonomuraea roseoviolacea subsp. carminata TaxID=160689 RepID=A0ABT1K6R4_9ACTN|nr:GNAT family N-acetyltransferase [Nonomuraea roseoviolacea]MCP2349299.1 ribosomal protein S18 acetylase RimI-like enzyme [Nonomuraea roseoviolacea subsp. carminata]
MTAPAPSTVLDDPVRASLLGAHARLAERRGRVLRYPPDVSAFLSMPPAPGPADWADVAALVGPGGHVALTGPMPAAPVGWEEVMDVPGVQLTGEHVAGADDADVVRLGPEDVPEMLDLVERTKPGPFLPRTIELGVYLGLRFGGVLVAMAGERLHPPGWTEISAVCTAPDHRGRGLATRLVLAVAAGIRNRGETPFLHAAAANTGAIRLYERLGFRLRRTPDFRAVRVPALDPSLGTPVPIT